ncbi:RNA recognition motif family protein [Giardia muris]|uniref:RNA recognition motif family protein n=1 Tax=Giardia muris TaxID=5742 RepID=A0A4Z1STA0_GIAMU|nr:RNA recognition motif family protein [Giardia muris]|eukprot:TNJ29156.1 RNA recognition motif family protein [Giardia muris]
MSENNSIKALEKRISQLEQCIFSKRKGGGMHGYMPINQAAILVKNLPVEIDHKQVREQVFACYTKSILYAESLGKGTWRVLFNSESVANQCLAKYRDARVNGIRIHCQLEGANGNRNPRNTRSGDKRPRSRRPNTATAE